MAPSSESLETIIKKKRTFHGIRFCKASISGLTYMLFGTFFLTLTNIIVKKSTHISVEQLTLVRCAGYIVWTIPVMVFTKSNMLGEKKERLYLFGCSFLGATGIYFIHLSFRILPILEATILQSTTPAIVMIGAKVFLKESCGLVSNFALILTFAGILLSVRVPELLRKRSDVDYFTTKYITGIASSLGCVLCFSGYYLVTRKLKTVHFSVSLMNLGVIGVLENVCLMYIFSSYELPYCGWDSLHMFCLALTAYLGMTLVILAIQSGAVGMTVVSKSCMETIFSLVFQVVLFSDPLDVYNSCAAVVITVAVSAIGLKKWVEQMPNESKWKTKLKFMLM